MRRHLPSLAILFLLALSARAVERVTEWSKDLEALRSRLAATHPKYKGCGLPRELSAAFDDLIGRADSLSGSRMAVEVQRLLASVGDGHTVLWPFGMKHEAWRRIPVMLWEFDDGVFVVQSESADLIGRRVERIGPLPIDEVAKRLRPYISHDNEMQLRWAEPFYATVTDFLFAIGATTSRDQVELTLDGKVVTLRSGAIDPATLDIKLPSPHRDVAFRADSLPGRIVYAQVNAINDTPTKPLATFAKELQSLLAESNAVILDLRWNNGGEARKANELLKTLIAFDVRGGRIVVLTSRMTFSAAQTLATRLTNGRTRSSQDRRLGRGRNHYGNERPFQLDGSGLRGTLASGLNQPVTANDNRDTITPDVPVRYTSRDYFSRRDPVLEAALKALSTSTVTEAIWRRSR